MRKLNNETPKAISINIESKGCGDTRPTGEKTATENEKSAITRTAFNKATELSQNFEES